MHLFVRIVACELKTGAIYPATFPDKGPDEDIRAAGGIVQETVRYAVFVKLIFCNL